MCQLYRKVLGSSDCSVLEGVRGHGACTKSTGLQSTKNSLFQGQQKNMCGWQNESDKLYLYGCGNTGR